MVHHRASTEWGLKQQKRCWRMVVKLWQHPIIGELIKIWRKQLSSFLIGHHKEEDDVKQVIKGLRSRAGPDGRFA